MQGCDMYLAFKADCHKLYRNLQLLLMIIYYQKNFSIDFVTGLLLSIDCNNNSYHLILVIVNRLTKRVHYESVKVTINAPRLVKVIINMVIQYHGFLNSMISNYKAIFISKFWSSLCYFPGIKRQLFTAFHLQIDKQTKWQNNIIEAYLCVFVN